MAHDPDTLQAAYTRITGEPWVNEPHTRIGVYKALAYKGQTRPEILLSLTDNMLTLFDKEKTQDAKLELLNSLTLTIRCHQRDFFVEPDFSSFYSRLVELTQDKKNAGYTNALIASGLDVASRERKPTSCGSFFHHVLGYTTTFKSRYTSAAESVPLESIAQKINTIACAHPELVIPKYIEACTALLSLPISDNNAPRDKILKRIHRKATLGLSNLIDAMGDGELTCPTYKLFTDDHLKTLHDIEITTCNQETKTWAKYIRRKARVWKKREHAWKLEPSLPEIFAKMKHLPPSAPN